MIKNLFPKSCLLLVMMSIGCGGATGPALVSVKGKVTVEGSEPFKHGIVRFIPAPGTSAGSGEAITDENGNFVIRVSSDKTGLQPGEYNVGFSLFQMPDGSPLPDQTGEPNPKEPAELGGVQFVPADYSIGSTKQTASVSALGETFEFDIPELKAQPKKGARR